MTFAENSDATSEGGGPCGGGMRSWSSAAAAATAARRRSMIRRSRAGRTPRPRLSSTETLSTKGSMALTLIDFDCTESMTQIHFEK